MIIITSNLAMNMKFPYVGELHVEKGNSVSISDSFSQATL